MSDFCAVPELQAARRVRRGFLSDESVTTIPGLFVSRRELALQLFLGNAGHLRKIGMLREDAAGERVEEDEGKCGPEFASLLSQIILYNAGPCRG
jgi:hypothetical protein